MHEEIVAQLIDDCRAKADAYLRCAEALTHLLPDPAIDATTPRQLKPPRPRRVLGSQDDYQAAILAQLSQEGSALGIAALVAQTGIARNSVATALRELQARGAIQKVGDYKSAIYRQVA